MMFEDLMSPETEEERRRRLEQTLGQGLGILDDQPAPTPTYQPPLNSMLPNAIPPSPVPGSSAPLPAPETYQFPLNSMKPNAIVPLPSSPMPGPYSSDMWQPPMNSMKPSAVVPLQSFDMADAATERQPLWANVMGPEAPGQRESDWKNYGNGVMINDGVTPGVPMQAQPGAGYTANGISIPHPSDMDWGARVAQEPYTNPLVQATIRDHQMKMELQKQALDSHLLNTQIAAGSKAEDKAEAARIRALKAAGDARLSPESRKAIINGISDLSPEEKQSFMMEADTVKIGSDGKPVRMGLGDNGSFLPLLPRISSAEPEVAQRFLESRGITEDQAIKRMNLIESKKRSMPWNRPTPEEITELEGLKRLYADKVENYMDDSTMGWIMSDSADKYRKRTKPGNLLKDAAATRASMLPQGVGDNQFPF